MITAFEGQGKELGNITRGFLQALLLGVVLVYIMLPLPFEMIDA